MHDLSSSIFFNIVGSRVCLQLSLLDPFFKAFFFFFSFLVVFWKWFSSFFILISYSNLNQYLGLSSRYSFILSITNSQSLPKLMSIESVIPSNHLILPCPLLLLPSIFPRIRVFSNESVLHIRWPKCWGFSFSISPSGEYLGLISVRIDWFDIAVQGTL